MPKALSSGCQPTLCCRDISAIPCEFIGNYGMVWLGALGCQAHRIARRALGSSQVGALQVTGTGGTVRVSTALRRQRHGLPATHTQPGPRLADRPPGCRARSGSRGRRGGAGGGGGGGGGGGRRGGGGPPAPPVVLPLESVLRSPDDPREVLDYSYERRLEILQRVRRGVADVATSRKRVELQTSQLKQSAAKLIR